MHILLNETYHHLEDYIKQLPDVFETSGKTIYTGRNLIKVFTAPDGTQINVKRYHAPRGINALVYSWGIRQPKGHRAYEYPKTLLEKGIDTPEAIAYIERRSGGLLRESYLVTRQCPYRHTMYEMGDAPAGSYERVAEAFARYTARMHEAGVMHLDYSPGNILWQEEEGKYDFSIVDINRMRFGSVDMRQGCTNLKRLWGPKRFFELVVKGYAEARGFDTEAAERIALAERARFWKRFGKKHPIKFKLEL
ncbi:MAG: aminoglycoside phosphotransferase [Prevotella sp.]|nr:aminoglycoside phosphotransferase [Prevotella sp.]